jgi:hypothetical protein
MYGSRASRAGVNSERERPLKMFRRQDEQVAWNLKQKSSCECKMQGTRLQDNIRINQIVSFVLVRIVFKASNT